ncbi:MAG: hypothetical protein COB24_00940 [Hyphomicrobiales bacterium]|nr:MAG: hypothetical protein COB24_00940 [Hyphomicrobiales bacterium]
MSPKNILINLNDTENLDHTLKSACALAARHDAHLIGVYVIPFFHINVSIHGSEVMMQELQDDERQRNREIASDMVKKFTKSLKSYGILGKTRVVNSVNSEIAEAFIKQARTADLVVIPQVISDQNCNVENDFVDKVVLSVGRPVVILPRGKVFEQIGNSVSVGWNLSAEASRAAFDAVPLMAKDGEVRFVWVDAKQENNNLPGAEIAEAFSHYGLNVTTASIQSGKKSVGQTLIHEADINGSDLLVMGAYGHSRLRELVFGGATLHTLKNMTLPVLMSR